MQRIGTELVNRKIASLLDVPTSDAKSSRDILSVLGSYDVTFHISLHQQWDSHSSRERCFLAWSSSHSF